MKRLVASMSMAAFVMCSPAFAQQTAPAPAVKPLAPSSAKPATAGQPKTDDKKPAAANPMEEAWMKAGEVGPNQKLLSWFAGEWEVTVQDLMTPGAAAEKGKMHAQMVLDGRILVQHFEGSMEGKPFTGMGSCGYNNTSKKFESTWMDSMSTATAWMTGTADAANKVFTYTGTSANPMTGSDTHEKWVVTITGKDTYKEEFFSDMMGGKETKIMELNCTRTSDKPMPMKKEEAKPAGTAKPAPKGN